MKELIFHCELLSDIILSGSGASEGRLPSLDFIPGSAFLGIIANQYEGARKSDLAYDLFHSGAVRFGDAHLLLNNVKTHKVPASWFCLKGETLKDRQVRLHHKLEEHHFEELTDNGMQLKQVRKGFIGKTDQGYAPADLSQWKQYAMKSAYDPDKRRSADSQLFGYTGLQPGTSWQFSVCLEKNDQLDKLTAFIKAELTGEQNIGHSRSAQYGRVRIDLVRENELDETTGQYSGEISLYCESRLIFLDRYGQPTLRPGPEMLGLPPKSAKILWGKSQLRTSRYAPWNSKRCTMDADRICIDKGSVLVVQLDEPADLPTRITGIGCYITDGFGELLVEPGFLQTNDTRGLFTDIVVPDEQAEASSAEQTALPVPDDPLISWLDQQQTDHANNTLILNKINHFVRDNKQAFTGKFASQWGAIRTIAEQSVNGLDLLNNLFGDNEAEPGYLMHGVAVEKWLKMGRRKILQDFIKKINRDSPDIMIPLIIRLAAEMAKAGQGSQRKKEKNNGV